MSEFGKRTDKVGGKRAAVRCPALVSAVVSTVARTETVELINISSTGARLRNAHVACGDTLLVKAGLFVALADVVWVHDALCGVQFDEPLSEAVVHEIEADPRSALFTRVSLDDVQAELDWRTGFAR